MTSIQDLLTATLTELGLPAPTSVIETLLLKDRYFVGQKFRYDGGWAVMREGSNTIEFFDEQGTLLKTVALKPERGTAA
jgi:hypothetical protein